jgi:seryl-tRNA synthetase
MNKDELLKPAIDGWRELDEKLGEYAILKNERDRVSTKLKAQIQKLQGALQEATADLDAKIHQTEQTMNIFVQSRLDEVRQEKSKQKVLTNGTVKTKTDPVYIYPDEDDLIFLLKKHKLLDCIKVEERAIKPVLKAKVEEDPKLLAKLGIEKDEETRIIYKLA